MSGFFKKRKIKEALKRAKELEKHQPMPKKKVVEIYKEGISFGEKIKNFLTPSWFVSDPHTKTKLKCPDLKKSRPKKSKKAKIKKKKTSRKNRTATKKRKVKKRKKR
ncbi:hypothetical protein GF358_02185 [Candidatus Woesearchaeota archaeon]|nr:hypothetical protein [Candidatus Woesearchaeota archaeon]